MLRASWEKRHAGKLIQIVREQLGDEPYLKTPFSMSRCANIAKHNKVVPDLSLPVSDRQWFENTPQDDEGIYGLPRTGRDLPWQNQPVKQDACICGIHPAAEEGNQPEIAMIIDPPFSGHDKLHLLERELMDTCHQCLADKSFSILSLNNSSLF
jgi:hypothetical protein